MTASIVRARLACVGLLVGLVACVASAQSAEAKTLRVQWIGIPTNIPMAVAEGEGIFKKHGLDVKLTRVSGGNPLPQLGKQFEIVQATVSEVLLFANKRADPMIINGGQVEPKGKGYPDLMVKKGITSLKELKGKTIGTVGVGTSQIWAGAMIAMQKVGMNPRKDVKFVEVPFPNHLDALRAGRIDAAVSVQPFVGQMQAAGYGPLARVRHSVAEPALGVQIISLASLIRKDEKTYRAFQRAYTEAVNLVMSNNALGFRYVQSELNLPAPAARATDFSLLRPLVQPKWITNWVKPMERLGLLKKNKLRKRNFVYQPGKNPKPAKK